jgi:hypothetical protein
MIRRLLAVLFASLVCIPGFAQESQQILIQEFSSWRAPKVERKNDRLTLEVCRDQCNYYTARGDAPEQALWDVALLHQLYFNREYQAEKFRGRHSKAGDLVTHRYDAGCEGNKGGALAKCVLSALAKKHDVRVAFVGYDEGLRCQVPARLIDPSWLGKSRTCTKIR